MLCINIFYFQNQKKNQKKEKKGQHSTEKYTARRPQPALVRQRSSSQLSLDSPIGRLWWIFCFAGIVISFGAYGIVMEYATSGGRKLHELSFIFFIFLHFSSVFFHFSSLVIFSFYLLIYMARLQVRKQPWATSLMEKQHYLSEHIHIYQQMTQEY